MKRRIFVALGISEELQRKIKAWEKNWRYLPARWINKENLHITLIPPWYESKISEIESKLRLNKSLLKPFTLMFQHITFGPNPNRPRLIWIEGEAPSEIVSIKNKLEKILDKRGEKRDYSFHMTLARFKPSEFLRFPVKRLNEKVFWQEKIRSFFLMESHLRSSGARYDKIAEVRL